MCICIILICVPGFSSYMCILFPVNSVMANPFGNLNAIIVGDMKNEA